MTDKASERSVEYDVFFNNTKLNISLCAGTDINVYVPIELSEETKKTSEEMEEYGYNIFDINDKFYRDFCTPYKSENNTDVLLSDRVDHYYNNDDAKCQDGCNEKMQEETDDTGISRIIVAAGNKNNAR